jgi:hypothetical protein
MTSTISAQAVIISDQSYQSDDPYEIIASNISFVNALFEAYLYPEEISADALRSYYVDYYLAQLNNGGFSQFVYNSGWNEQLITLVREGLLVMNTDRNLAFFQQGAALLATLGQEQLEAFFESDYFGENAERDALSALDEQFSVPTEQEDLIALNAAWLRHLPHLVVLPIAAMEAEVQKRSNAIPDRDKRIARAWLNKPDYMKLIRALCTQVGYELSRVTAGDPAHIHAGQPTLAWHFITDHGHHYVVEADGKALLFHGETCELIVEISIPDNL